MDQEYTHILVPVDGSALSEKAFVTAVEITKRNHGHLDILNVIDLKPFSVSFVGTIDANGEVVYQTFEEVDSYLDTLVQKAEAMGLKDVDSHARFGAPRMVIANEFPSDHNIDLIVMGPTGLNRVERMFVGSVTDFVIRNATCDVMIAH